ncbi:MAG: hypothetical protein ACXWTR_04665 [Methylotenera sp.]
MKLTVDCVLTNQLSALQHDSALARLLTKAHVTQVEVPLEALICAQHGLQAEPDYPIAAIAAAADGLEVGDAYWLRADPVHLVLQRDCFSLGEPIPLLVEPTHAAQLIASLNQHFGQDGLVFFIGKSGAWYLRFNKAPEIKTTLPSVAADKNIHQFLPQGVDAAKWIAMLNEVQMLLHEHPANVARESIGAVAVNSIWLSGGGVMPQSVTLKSGVSLILSNSAFYQGLAKLTHTSCQAAPADLESLLLGCAQHAHVRLQLPEMQNLQIDQLDGILFDDIWFNALLTALKNKRIEQLILNLGFYEKSLIVDIKPLDTYKFWRKTKPVMHFLP